MLVLKRKLQFCFGLFCFMLLISLPAFSQNIIVTGKVVNANDNTPLAGASVSEQGSTRGTTTDKNGFFSLTVSSTKPVLLFSSVGYQGFTLNWDGVATIDVKLEPVASSLQDLIVVGYSTQKKTSVTGAVAQVTSKQLNIAPASNASQMLAGRLPGLITKTASSLPGNDAATLQIRGYGDALIIVDGLPTGFNRVDPNDIESISILKDASAAIYGARAGNGVILITTKRGKTGPPTINYTGNFTIQNLTAFQETVNAGDYAELKREAALNAGLQPEFTEDDVQKFKAGTEPNFGSYSWRDALFRQNAPMFQHSLSVSGGTDAVKYFASAGMTDQQSVFSSGDYYYKRYNVRLNLDANINKELSFRFDLQYRYERVQQVTAINDVFNDFETAQPRYSPFLPDPSKNGYSGFSQRNPLLRTQADRKGYDRDFNSFFTGTVGLNYKIPFISGLKLSGEVFVSQSNNYNKNFNLPAELYTYDYVTQIYTKMADNGTAITLREETTRGSQIYPRLMLNYDRSFGQHKISALAVAEQIENKGNTFFAFRRDLLSSQVDQLFSGGVDFQNNSGSASQGARGSYIGKINYEFSRKYLAELILRADASANFPTDTRWGYFPGVSLGWRFSNEKFMDNFSDWLSEGKLRLSYGKSGNDNTSQFSYLTGYEIDAGGYIIGSSSMRSISTTGISNPEITWEEINNYNLGLDLTMFRGKLTFEGNVFRRTRDGILATKQLSLPSTFGATLPPVNLNKKSNRGFEFMVDYRPKIGKVSFNLMPTFTLTKERWEYRDEEVYTDPDQIRIYKLTGRNSNLVYGLLSDGIFMSLADIKSLKHDQDQNGNQSLRPGDIRYVDLNGDGVINWKDQTVIGKGTIPEVVYSMIMGASYKNFSLEMVWQGATGFNFYISGAARAMFSNESIPLDYHYKYRWIPDPNNPTSNINPDAKLPAAGFGINQNNGLYSDFWLKDATFLRLKTFNLSYNLNREVLKKINFKDAQVYISGTNIFTISKLGYYKNTFDPDANVNGVGRNYPIHRNLSIGLRLSL